MPAVETLQLEMVIVAPRPEYPVMAWTVAAAEAVAGPTVVAAVSPDSR